MAFDLNKNDGVVKDSSEKKTGSAKFDLAKGEGKVAATAEDTSSSKKWIIGLVGLLLIGAGIWYYTTDRSTENSNIARTEGNLSDSVTAIPSTVEATKVSPVVENTTDVVAKTAASVTESPVSLNNKTAATFAQGSSSFNKMDQSLIKNLLSYLKENPGASIQLNGYASSDGTLEINQTVSQARADALKQYLVSKDITESRILALGKGIENPIASNETNAGRKKNRRVEIILP